MLNVSRRSADCRVNTDQTHSSFFALILSSLFLTIALKLQLGGCRALSKRHFHFASSFREKCKSWNLAADSFCLCKKKKKWESGSGFTFASSTALHLFLPVYKYFLRQIYFLSFGRVIKMVMDDAWLIDTGLLCPRKQVNICFSSSAAPECTLSEPIGCWHVLSYCAAPLNSHILNRPAVMDSSSLLGLSPLMALTS